MTIHSSHPFATPDDEKSAVRQLRGRLAAPVSVWTSGGGTEQQGLTVSSFLIVDGDPGRVLGVVDPDSAWWEFGPVAAMINVLGDGHQFLADAFAGIAPAPGGPFTLGSWTSSAWGPALSDAVAWVGVSFDDEPRPSGWGLVVEAAIEHIEITDRAPLQHVRGRYRL